MKQTSNKQMLNRQNWLFKVLRTFNARNELLQVAALPWRRHGGHVEICMVTSRGTGRWILPKGWPEKKLSHSEAAAIEAWEEAGLKGSIAAEACGSYLTAKAMRDGLELAVRMNVYLMPEPRQRDKFPEAGERDVAWLPLEDAIELANETGLKDLLRELDDAGAFD
jgi:8-oxo-dGTP pyrophosphatase MutT (NUDIX family)